MNISIKDTSNFYTYLKEIGYYGLDVGFEGYTAKEFILSADYTDFIIDKFNKITSAGLKVCQTHLTYYPAHIKPLGNGTYQDFEDYMLDIFIKEIELTAFMNCKVCVIHLYFEQDETASRKGNIQLISKLLPYAEKHNIIIAIENIYGNNGADAHLSTYEDFIFYMDYFKSPYLRVCLDSGHAVLLKQNPVLLFRQLKDYIAAVHLHSAVPNIDLHAIPYTVSYVESIKWNELYCEMKNSNYNGTFNFEISAPFQLNDKAKKAYYLFAYETAKSIMEMDE